LKGDFRQNDAVEQVPDESRDGARLPRHSHHTESLEEQAKDASHERLIQGNESGLISGDAGRINGADDYLSPLLNELHAKSIITNLSRDELKTLRSRSCVLAARVAQSYGIAELLRSTSIGFGFLIEMPGTPIRNESIWWGWWILVGLSEEMITRSRLDLLSDAGMKLPDLFDASGKDDPDTGNRLFSHLGASLDLGVFPHQFLLSLRMLSNRAFKDLVHLIDCCRFMRTHFPEPTLWNRPTVDQLRQSAVFVGVGSDGGQQQ